MLESTGYQVLTAKTGAEALSVLKNYSGFVDLFLIDMVLSDIDGGNLGERLIAINPRIILAYMSSRSDEVLSLIEGIKNSGIIQKPFTMTTLLERVRRCLDSRN
jgi:DNA-binding response OmpR family regulator